MKHVKKLLAMVLALVMIMSLAVSAFAEENEGEEETFTITITTSASGASVKGHKYEVYQIFTGTVAADGKTLSDVAFGKNYAPAGKTVDAALEELSTKSGSDAANFLLEELTDEEAFGELKDENNHTLPAVPGYYLIIDVTEGLPSDIETKSAYILQVLEDVEVISKHDATPKTEKKIDDVNDSSATEEVEIEWHDSADHDIGDDISFKLELKVPSTIKAFKEAGEPYTFTFHDTEEQGLTFNDDAKVYVDGVEITSGFEVVFPADDGHTFDVKFADLTAIESVEPGSVISVIYTSELNENAILGSQGNVNTMYGEYARFGYPDEPGLTPEDSVIAFTYKVIVNKVDEEGEALSGAEFSLEKYYAETDSWKAIEKVSATADTVFEFKGLDDGEYRLTEDKAPDGYNKIDPIYFTVEAGHTLVWEGENRTSILTSLTGNDKEGGEVPAIEFDHSESAGTLSADVENKSGVVLPETGGIGTTLFYVLGSAMVIVAVVFLVTKKRMSNME